jgi:uncharacterized OsmC-like protein
MSIQACPTAARAKDNGGRRSIIAPFAGVRQGRGAAARPGLRGETVAAGGEAANIAALSAYRERNMTAARNLVTTSEAGSGKFATKIEIGRHSFVADEPLSVGGGDAGPSPVQLMLASLGACTSMTLRAYAAFKNWSLGPIRVEVSHERRKNEAGQIHDHFERVIHIDGELTEGERAKLAEIAGKCPMHKLLMATDKTIETRVA